MPTNKIIPHMVVTNGQEALDWYRDVLGAVITHVMPGPDGKIMHSGIVLGDTTIFLTDAVYPGSKLQSPEALNGTSFSFYANVDDVDGTYAKALAAGASSIMAPMDAFWGDRWANITDPFGHNWQLGKQQEQLTPEQMQERMHAAMANGGM